MGDRKLDMSQLLRKLVMEKLELSLDDLDTEDIIEEAEEEGMNLNYVKSCLKDGTYEEMVSELKSDLRAFLANE